MNYVPLGGDGINAPHAAYTVVGHKISGDVSGGDARLSVVMDPRFVSLVSWFHWSIDQGTAADADVSLILSASQGKVPLQSSAGPVVKTSATIQSSTIQKTWSPNPILLPGGDGPAPTLSGRALNVDGDDYFMSCFIYVFNIRVRELSPMGGLLWARGGAAGSVT